MNAKESNRLVLTLILFLVAALCGVLVGAPYTVAITNIGVGSDQWHQWDFSVEVPPASSATVELMQLVNQGAYLGTMHQGLITSDVMVRAYPCSGSAWCGAIYPGTVFFNLASGAVLATGEKEIIQFTNEEEATATVVGFFIGTQRE